LTLDRKDSYEIIYSSYDSRPTFYNVGYIHSFIYSGNKRTNKKLTNIQDKLNKETHRSTIKIIFVSSQGT